MKLERYKKYGIIQNTLLYFIKRLLKIRMKLLNNEDCNPAICLFVW